MMEFDRNRLREFVDAHKAIELSDCTKDHSDIVTHKIYPQYSWPSIWKSIGRFELNENYNHIGSMCDPKIQYLDYLGYDEGGTYGSKDNKIATNFYPYHNSDLYECKECKKLVLVYEETAGHFPELRLRKVVPELIKEELSNRNFYIDNEHIGHLQTALNLSPDEFEEALEKGIKQDFWSERFDQDEVMIMKKESNRYLLVAKRERLYEIIDLLEPYDASTK